MRLIGIIDPGHSLAMAAISAEVTILIVDDREMYHPPMPKLEDAVIDLKISHAAAIEMPFIPVEKGPRRAQNPQPFYRGLKKYRKP